LSEDDGGGVREPSPVPQSGNSAGPPHPEDLAARFTGVEGPEFLSSGFDGRLFHTFFIWRLRDARP
jgi:hypothetical protein